MERAPCSVILALLTPLLLWPSGNVVARDAGSSPDALAVSGDSRLLAFVGPSKYVVTVMEASSLDEVPGGVPTFPGGGQGRKFPQTG